MATPAPTPAPTATGDGTLLAAAHLPDDLATLKQMILELLATLREERRDRAALQHRVEQLLRRLYGPRGEGFRPDQPLLFSELDQATATATAPPEEPKPKPRRRCKPHGRRRLPDHLRRTQRHYTLTEAERVCAGCGHVRNEIGVDLSEQLDYEPASLFIIEHIRHKYACPHCAGQEQSMNADSEPSADVSHESPTRPVEIPLVEMAAAAPASAAPALASPPVTVVVAGVKPATPIAKGLPGAGLLAYIIVSKYVDHLPLHRLERICERQGYFLPRSTTCDWLAACAHALAPLHTLMVSVVLQSRALHTDDTPVQIHGPPPGTTDTGRLWSYLGDAKHPYNVFDFTPNRKRDGPQQFLANFRGYLHADAFSGYDGLYLPQPGGGAAIVEVACNAHARRKFYEARSSDAARPHQALAYYGQLYEIERQAKALEADDVLRLQMRQDLAVPILNQFRTWLEVQRPDVLPKSPFGEAIGYARNNWRALIRYTEAGFLAIDNNVAEREMKRIAIGRKNWLFVGSVSGGKTAAVLFSFTSTCQRLGVEPWAYLKDVLARLPTVPPAQLVELLPERWQAARAATGTARQ
jgi:transposase